jgi:hypothetical protein
MKRILIALLTAVSLTQTPGLLAQEKEPAFASPDVASIQQAPAEKVPALAGGMSFLVPGLGSLYAGNSGHGLTHLVVAAGSFAGLLATNSSCEIIFAGPDSNCTGVAFFGIVFVGNWIWSIATAAKDANAYNRSLYSTGLQVAPDLVAIRSSGQTTIGLQLLRVGF